MAPVVDNNQFELPTVLETPGKKRKRNADTNPFLSFSDQTFSIPSSTPIHNKQIDGSAFENPSFRFGATGNDNGSNKENYNIFSDSCMEVKSIAELAAAVGENPFEVVRKPPSKKQRKVAEIEESCFVNPGLNLDAVDKPAVNPFEVVRADDSSKQENESCFVNGGLNIKSKECGEVVNPFEISRPGGKGPEQGVEEKAECKGIENPALEIPTYALAVPFTPSINHRINFQELSANALTPCQMLAKNLVFSPEPSQDNLVTPKRAVAASNRKSLSVIDEEPLDIGEELDCYQLELENSINEAKARKQKSVGGSTGARTKARRSLIGVKHISNLSMKMKQLEESEGEEEVAAITEQPPTPPTPQTQMTFTIVKETTTTVQEEIRINVSNPDVQFEEVDDFEDEEQDVDLFANPAPFQRAYRKKEDPKQEDNFKHPPLPEVASGTKSHKVKDVIRRSFRKLMHPKQQHHDQVQITDLDEKPKSEEGHHGFISTIRHSFRRKVHKTKDPQQKDEDGEAEKVLDMSVIVEAPRAVFRQPSADEYRTIVPGGSMDKVGSTLRSSLRRSTKDMKKQMMKNVFKKAGEE
ncbi:uncharacterized protein LOC135700630 [Ochlerotatus camptorhynchus]|uniref:uncharacterized protein LOC135700630 n=1 Tax=Ochlerotatus camptorhynchus TaxID=644619 RepID=UPI0031E2A5C1